MEAMLKTGEGILRLKRSSAIGIGIEMVWMCLAGGYMLAKAGEVFGWIAIIFGLILLASPFTAMFRRCWSTEEPARRSASWQLVQLHSSWTIRSAT